MRTFRGKFIFFRQISFSNALFKKSADWSMTHPTGIRNHRNTSALFSCFFQFQKVLNLKH